LVEDDDVPPAVEDAVEDDDSLEESNAAVLELEVE
jgi:hypothetical protein